jgi:nucleoside-diphosphate-sugar epimerase
VLKEYVTPDLPVRPDGYYGASKAYGEALGRWYNDAFGLPVINLRIGSYLDRPTSARNLSTWLSPRDMAQITWRAIESDAPWGIFYAISGNTRRYWDISDTQRVLGYEPEDNAEKYAAEIEGRR